MKKKLLFAIILAFNFTVRAQVCGTPTTGTNQDFSELAGKTTRAPSIICINIAFHIVRRSDGTGGFNPANIGQIVENLNDVYNPRNIIINSVGVDFINNSGYFDLSDSEFNGLISLNNVSNAINFYLVNSAPYAGRAQNILSKNLVTVNNSALSPTSAHEVGHCLNLWHTHHGLGCNDTGGCAEAINGSNCSSCGDFVCDTPADPCVLGQLNANCQYIGGGGYNPDPTNLMSYGGNCRTHFTTGQGTRMRLAINNSSLLQQVISNQCSTPVANGPSLVCSGGSTFTLSNVPSGANVTWEATPANLFQSGYQNGTGTTANVRALISAGGQAQITFTVNGGITISKETWAGNARIESIFGPTEVYSNLYHTYHALPESGHNGDYHWQVYPDNVSYTTSVNWKDLAFTSPYNTIIVYTSNPCGNSNEYNFDVYVTNYFSMSPNPASDEVEISIDKKGLEERQNKEDTTYIVQVFDTSGTLVYSTEEKTNTFTFSTANFRSGTYIVSIENGKVKGRKKLIVNH